MVTWEERDESDARSRDPWLSPTAAAFSEEASSDSTAAEVAVRSPSKHGDRAPSCGLWLGLDGDGHLQCVQVRARATAVLVALSISLYISEFMPASTVGCTCMFGDLETQA